MARFNITDGPSMWSLILALYDGNCAHRREVAFSIQDPQQEPEELSLPPISCVINGTEREDGSSDNWLFKGYYPGSAKTTPVHGFFSIKNRKGWIEISF